MHAVPVALLSFTALAAASVTELPLEIKVAAGSNLEGYQLVGAPDFPEYVPLDQIGNKTTHWYLAHFNIGFGAGGWDYLLININGTTKELNLGGDRTNPGPLEYIPSTGSPSDELNNRWSASEPLQGYQFAYANYVGTGQAHAFACANTDGRYLLNVYPPGTQPENCVEVDMVWNRTT
ncbi:hypothetical protein F4777DRAFT_354990 [Nemania sp. FL0916]|nr:hypothetical protein F4777DRAFT_354990 [Nemania sp. FL0916]